jgi:dihydrodipicolinate synthase/N-acetylneuraminate lyase
LFGSTGEFIHYDPEERKRLAALSVKRSRLPMLINVSHSSLAGAVEIAQHAIDAGAAGLMLMPPYFYTYGEEQIFAFYAKFLNAIGGAAPIYLYNLPMFVNPITPVLAERLLETGSFAGIKDSSGDAAYLQRLQSLHAKLQFQLLSGSERLYPAARRAGANGIVSGVAAALPELVVALDRAITSSDTERGERLSKRLEEYLGYLDRFPATVIIRQTAVARGWSFSAVAVPFDEDLSAELIGFHAWFREWWPPVLGECSLPAAVRT